MRRTSAGRLVLRADHEAGRVDERDDREPERVAERQEPRRLVRRRGGDRARRGTSCCWRSRRPAGPRSGPARSPSRARTARAARRPSPRRPGPRSPARRRRRGAGSPAAASRSRVLVGRRPASARGPGSSPSSCLVTATASASSATTTSTTPFGACISIGPTSSGVDVAEPAARDHRRPAHPERRVLGRDDQVRAAGDHGVAGEAAALDDRDPRHLARQPRPQRERARVQRTRRPGGRCRPAARRRPRRRTRPAAASARSARTAGPSCGGRPRPACRPAPCSRRRAPRTACAADPRGAGDQPVGRACARSAPRRRGAGAGRRSRSARTRPTMPGSTRSATFSRAVRPPLSWRRATASGRAASSVSARRRSSSARSLGSVASMGELTIADVLAVPVTGAYFADDQAAIKAGAVRDGLAYPGRRARPGRGGLGAARSERRLRRARGLRERPVQRRGRARAAAARGGAGGHDRARGRAAAARSRGDRRSARLAARASAPRPTTALSQALLDAAAHRAGTTMAEVIAAEWGLDHRVPAPARSTPRPGSSATTTSTRWSSRRSTRCRTG